MHIPKLGSYHLVLRDKSKISNYHKGELLIDYNDYDLYYCDSETGELIKIAEEIKEEIIHVILSKATFDIVKDKEDIPVDVPNIPNTEDRIINHWYYDIEKIGED